MAWIFKKFILLRSYSASWISKFVFCELEKSSTLIPSLILSQLCALSPLPLGLTRCESYTPVALFLPSFSSVNFHCYWDLIILLFYLLIQWFFPLSPSLCCWTHYLIFLFWFSYLSVLKIALQFLFISFTFLWKLSTFSFISSMFVIAHWHTYHGCFKILIR